MRFVSITQLAFGCVVALAVLAGAIYALAPSRHRGQASAQAARTVAAKTTFAPVTPLATITPLPTPDIRPRVLDVSTGAVRTLDLGAGFGFEHLMSDGSILAGNGSGKLEAVTRDGRVLAEFSNRGEPALSYSTDDRYAAWYDGHGLKVYDAVMHQVVSSLPADASFPQQLADGSLILCVTRECGASVLVGSDGAFTRTFAVPQSAIAIFPQARRIAWPAVDGMHVYDAASGAERTYASVHWVVGAVAVSPDAAHLAYGRLTGDNAVHVRVVDLASGAERELYAGPPNARVDALTFATNSRVTFDVTTDPTRPDAPATAYAYNIDGTQAGVVLGARPWSTCGPACGLPPADSVGPGGIAFWCEPPPADAPPSAGCLAHVVHVDRAAGTVRDLFTATGVYSDDLSADGKTLAAAIIDPNGFDTVVHLIDLSTYADRSYRINLRVPFADVHWFPDGTAVLLTVSSGV